MMQSQVNTIDEYIEGFNEPVKSLLQEMRSIIQSAAPKAVETIKYAMPTYQLGKNLVHFAGYTNHIGFYPAPSGILAFKDELTRYKTSKGAIQFPVDKRLPVTLIKKIVRYRVQEELARSKKK